MVLADNIRAAPTALAIPRHFTVRLGSTKAVPIRSVIPRLTTAQADNIRVAVTVSVVASTITSATIAAEASAASNEDHPPYPRIRRRGSRPAARRRAGIRTEQPPK